MPTECETCLFQELIASFKHPHSTAFSPEDSPDWNFDSSGVLSRDHIYPSPERGYIKASGS
jgi:hypothetical protein